MVDGTLTPELLQAYLRAVVRIRLLDGKVLTITPATLPPEGAGREVDLGMGPLSLLRARRVDVLTAANPLGVPASDAVNLANLARLRVALRQRGVEEIDLRPALGRAPRGHERWVEPSLALLDVPDALVVVHARIHRQLGWYRWDRRGWRLHVTGDPANERLIPAVGRVSRVSEPLDDGP